MNRFLSAFVAIALLTGGFLSPVVAQETEGPPRLTPEERREQWEQLRGLSPEDRRARFQQLRERRAERFGREEPAEPLGAPPERYLDQLELRSVLSLDGVTEFSLRNPYENRTFLVSENQSRNGIEVVEFKADENSLTLRHEGEIRTLTLQASRVLEMDDDAAGSETRRGGGRGQGREERWERFRQFRATWDEAAQKSPELQEIEVQFRELMGDFRQSRAQLRDLEPGSPEHERLRAQELEMREELRLLTEYSLLEVRRNPAFEAHESESLERMMRGMMFRRGDSEGSGEGERILGRGRPEGR